MLRLFALPLSLALLQPVAMAAASAQAAAPKPAVAACPERLRTMAVTPADPTRIAGFETVVGGATSSQAFLQDVSAYTGSADAGSPLKGRADGRKKITWTFDGTADVNVACVYEGGVSLTRAMGRPKSCTAAIRRSKDARPGSASGWGMERASFRCK